MRTRGLGSVIRVTVAVAPASALCWPVVTSDKSWPCIWGADCRVWAWRLLYGPAPGCSDVAGLSDSPPADMPRVKTPRAGKESWRTSQVAFDLDTFDFLLPQFQSQSLPQPPTQLSVLRLDQLQRQVKVKSRESSKDEQMKRSDDTPPSLTPESRHEASSSWRPKMLQSWARCGPVHHRPVIVSDPAHH